MDIFHLNILSLIFFGVLSFFIYYIGYSLKAKRQILIVATLIFLLNGVIYSPTASVVTHNNGS
ncbi:hypothetical protein [Garciella nitratireducens]|uniref:hypothetical protein n=1 Tax=Garciella nitratireducens TaxID=218205 RepID=UPI000DE98A84|nr:hypothetical protein [Garciella nitratireducens]